MCSWNSRWMKFLWVQIEITHKITINNVNYQYKKNFRLIVNSRVSKNICSFPHIHILLKNLLINLCLCIKQCQIFERSNLISIYKFLQLSMHSGITYYIPWALVLLLELGVPNLESFLSTIGTQIVKSR